MRLSAPDCSGDEEEGTPDSTAARRLFKSANKLPAFDFTFKKRLMSTLMQCDIDNGGSVGLTTTFRDKLSYAIFTIWPKVCGHKTHPQEN